MNRTQVAKELVKIAGKMAKTDEYLGILDKLTDEDILPTSMRKWAAGITPVDEVFDKIEKHLDTNFSAEFEKSKTEKGRSISGDTGVFFFEVSSEGDKVQLVVYDHILASAVVNSKNIDRVVKKICDKIDREEERASR